MLGAVQSKSGRSTESGHSNATALFVVCCCREERRRQWNPVQESWDCRRATLPGVISPPPTASSTEKKHLVNHHHCTSSLCPPPSPLTPAPRSGGVESTGGSPCSALSDAEEGRQGQKGQGTSVSHRRRDVLPAPLTHPAHPHYHCPRAIPPAPAFSVAVREGGEVGGFVRAKAEQRRDALVHPGSNPGANLKSISHRCHPILVAFVWESTKVTTNIAPGLPPGRLERWGRAGERAGNGGRGLAFKAHRPFYRSTLGSRVMQKEKRGCGCPCPQGRET